MYPRVKIVTLPGAPPPSPRAACVADALRRETLPLRASVLDVASGSGLLAITAARRGARSVTALDSGRVAALTLRLNARLNGVRLRVLRGNVDAGLAGRRYDVILSSAADPDDLVAVAADHLRPCGFLLVACAAGPPARFALAVLRDAGLDAEIVTSPADLEADRHGTVVVRGRAPARAPWVAPAHAAAI